MGLFGGNRSKKKGSSAADDDAIPEDLLDTIPDVDDALKGLAADADEEDDAAPVKLRVEVAPPSQEVHALLQEVRRGMEDAFQREMDRVENSFAMLVQQMDARLRAANEQLTNLAQERAALEQQNATYARRFAQLKALADDP